MKRMPRKKGYFVPNMSALGDLIKGVVDAIECVMLDVGIAFLNWLE